MNYIVVHEMGPNAVDDETVAIPLDVLGPWKPCAAVREDGQEVDGTRLVVRAECDDMFSLSATRSVTVRESFSEVCDLIEKAR